MLAQRFPATQPQLVHRVHRLDRARARELFGAIAGDGTDDGLLDVHRYLTIELDGQRINVDVTVSGEPWDGRSPLALACGPGRDFLAARTLTRT